MVFEAAMPGKQKKKNMFTLIYIRPNILHKRISNCHVFISLTRRQSAAYIQMKCKITYGTPLNHEMIFYNEIILGNVCLNRITCHYHRQSSKDKSLCMYFSHFPDTPGRQGIKILNVRNVEFLIIKCQKIGGKEVKYATKYIISVFYVRQS